MIWISLATAFNNVNYFIFFLYCSAAEGNMIFIQDTWDQIFNSIIHLLHVGQKGTIIDHQATGKIPISKFHTSMDDHSGWMKADNGIVWAQRLAYLHKAPCL